MKNHDYYCSICKKETNHTTTGHRFARGLMTYKSGAEWWLDNLQISESENDDFHEKLDAGLRFYVAGKLVTLVKGTKFVRINGKKKRIDLPNHKTHARKHPEFGGGNPVKYYQSAVRHLFKHDYKFKVRHGGQNKYVYITKLGHDQYKFTSTNLTGTVIFTHLKVDGRYLLNKGIKLPSPK